MTKGTETGADEFCEPGTPSYPKWTAWDAIMWKLAPDSWTGGLARLFSYKDAWVRYNGKLIRQASSDNKIPTILLAGVAWAEAGGMPDFVKGDVVFPLRSFVWSGPDWVDRHLTITAPPGKTSFGTISMQLRVAAHIVGVDLTTLSYSRQIELSRCLETDAFNIAGVAKYLRALILIDYPNGDTSNLTEEQFVIAGSRYNRGTQRKLADFIASNQAPKESPLREYTSYGHRMLLHRERVANALGAGP